MDELLGFARTPTLTDKEIKDDQQSSDIVSPSTGNPIKEGVVPGESKDRSCIEVNTRSKAGVVGLSKAERVQKDESDEKHGFGTGWEDKDVDVK